MLFEIMLIIITHVQLGMLRKARLGGIIILMNNKVIKVLRQVETIRLVLFVMQGDTLIDIIAISVVILIIILNIVI
jgi:hypothetical protein